MASAPRHKAFRLEDFPGAPEWFEMFIVPFNEFSNKVTNALSGGLSAENYQAVIKDGVVFVTSTPASDTVVYVKNQLSTKPRLVQLGNIKRSDGGAITAAVSMTSSMNSADQIELRFQGLAANTKYEATVYYE